MHVNLNFSGQLHVDGSNRGPTLMLTLGDATGGDLWVHPNFLAAYPLRICTDAEHEGDRVMRFDSHHFASSNGRLTHCKQCKRRYIQKRRSVGRLE